MKTFVVTEYGPKLVCDSYFTSEFVKNAMKCYHITKDCLKTVTYIKFFITEVKFKKVKCV